MPSRPSDELPDGEERRAPLPAFSQPSPEDPFPEDPEEENEPPSTTSEPSPSTSSGSGASSPSSSRTSSEAKAVAGEIAKVTTGLAQLVGIVLNRFNNRRARTPDSRLWLMTEGEAKGIGEPLAAIAARRAPEEIVEGDGADLFAVGATVVGYGMRNVAGVDDLRMARILAGEEFDVEPQPAAAPAPPPPPPPPPPARADVPAPPARTGDAPSVLENL